MDGLKIARLRSLAVFFGSSFVLHLLWEMAQMPLFRLPEMPRWERVKMCLFSTATGDMAFMLTLYLTVAAIHQQLWWLADRRSYTHAATWILQVLVGGLLAISFELWAVYAIHRWEYASMPLVPVIRVGVTPLLQMILVPLAATALCFWLVVPRSRS